MTRRTVRPPSGNSGMLILLCLLVGALIWYFYGGGRFTILRAMYGSRQPVGSNLNRPGDAQKAVALVKGYRPDAAQVTVVQRLQMLRASLQARGVKLETESW